MTEHKRASENMGQPDVQPKDDVVEALQSMINAIIFAKRRYPLLLAAAKELDALSDLMKAKTGNDVPIRNDAVLQLLRDTFDMLVIDLASIREGLIESAGILNKLKENPTRLRRCERAEIAPRPVMVVAEADHARIKREVEDHGIELVVRGINAALERLIPGVYPVTTQAVSDLISRLIKETDPIDKDRNHVRAHRYEFRNFDRTRYFQPLQDLQTQIDILESCIGDLYLVLTHNSHSLELCFMASTSRTAQDLADLLIHGSINSAVNEYDVVRKIEENPIPWYYYRREQFFKAAPTPRPGA